MDQENQDEFSVDYPLGGTLEPNEIVTEDELAHNN